MKLKLILTAILLLSIISCTDKNKNTKRYIYYLHGCIIEIQGKNAVSEQYGRYEFDKIVTALKVENSEVIAKVRNENVDYLDYARKVSKD